MVTEKDAKPGFASVHDDISPVWLRLLIRGEDVTSQYRVLETDPWKTVGKSNLPSPAKARAGVTSGGAPKGSEREAKFSHFRIVRVD